MATKNNWFTTNLAARTKDNLCDFEISIKPYNFKKGIFLEEAKRVARDLVYEYDNLYIGYSGGLDSEFVLKTFYEQGLPITPVLIDTPYNNLESEWALKFCKDRNIKFEVLSFTKNEIIDKLKQKTLTQGFYSLLGGLPIIICDEVNKIGGKLLTGYGEPFTTIPGLQPNHKISTKLEFCEWDYYLDTYDRSHPSGFFTYDLGLFYSLVEQIRYDCATQVAKYEFYNLPSRQKMFWKKEFYNIFIELKIEVEHNYYIEKNTLFQDLNNYRME